MRMSIKLIAALALLAAMAGCGYNFSGAVVSLPPGAETIVIPVFANKTAEPGIELDFTNDLIFEFNRSRALKVVSPPGDLILSGAIEQVLVEPVAYSAAVIAVERRVALRVSARLAWASSGVVLWEDPAIYDNEVFPVAADAMTTERSRREAIQRISERVAQQIHNRALEGF